MSELPVLIIGFRRLEPLKQVLLAVETHHSGPIFVFLDDARDHRPDDAEPVRSVRDWVSDWARSRTNVKLSLADGNVGLAKAIPMGIDWVFDSGHDRIVVLEDDCLPAPDLFRFMAEQLSVHEEDERVMMVSGNQFLPESLMGDYPWGYYYSRYIHIWGWGTWKRAWQHYDHSMGILADAREATRLRDSFPRRREARFYFRTWTRQVRDSADTAWASRWLLACLVNGGLCVSPVVNLVRNIGFGGGSTHTARASRYQVVPRGQMDWGRQPPPVKQPWAAGDRWWFDHMISRSPWARGRRFLLRVDPTAVEDDIWEESK